ncbi:DUF1853 family protein [Oxalobacteraceae bacterium A2-2]
MTSPASAFDPYQAGYAQRWPHLHHPHVRALAWLLDAPGLLDPAASLWQGRIASCGPATARTAAWLQEQEHDPSALEAALGQRSHTRLGLYAEQLMAYYFRQQGVLHAHGLQVRDHKDTVGEFDFLLDEDGALVHLEFATKFYLLDGVTAGFGGLVGPNLADTLGYKMRKIFDQQLALADHPAAQALLARPVRRAQALVKGWLFYPAGAQPRMEGIAAPHCHGFWMTHGEAATLPGGRYVLLPRMQWLAPWKGAPDSVEMDKQAWLQALDEHMASAATPIMTAVVAEQDGWLVEQRRGFIVPDGWREQAAARRASGALPV